MNQQQLKASNPDFGVNIVLAGAGTGKTRTLIEKVKNVITYTGIVPHQVLVLTFSRKAADEIKERIKRDAVPAADAVTSGTFHSFCLDLLLQNSGAFISKYGFSSFPGVLDEEAESELFRAMIRSRLAAFKGLPSSVVFDFVRRRRFLSSALVEKMRGAGILNEIDALIAEYNAYKKDNIKIDFDDMIFFASELLDSDQNLRNSVLARYRYIFVDEFQDTSDENFRLLKLLLPDTGANLFAVGDDFQSIYGFRGSNIDYTVNLGRYFTGARSHKLTLNYRSRKEIVKISSRFIKRNRKRSRKRLVSDKGPGGQVRLITVSGFDEEAGVIDDILKAGDTPHDTAVLYRNNFQGEYIRNNLSNGCADRALFMTIHASKGLEFDTVIIAGVSDKIIPDRSSDMEEERRLLYVAMTRARERLILIAHLRPDSELPVFIKELGFKKSPEFKANGFEF